MFEEGIEAFVLFCKVMVSHSEVRQGQKTRGKAVTGAFRKRESRNNFMGQEE